MVTNFAAGDVVLCTHDNSPVGNYWFGVVLGNETEVEAGCVPLALIEEVRDRQPMQYRGCGLLDVPVGYLVAADVSAENQARLVAYANSDMAQPIELPGEDLAQRLDMLESHLAE